MAPEGRRILLVDDEPDLRRLFARWAQKARRPVEVISSARELRLRAVEVKPAAVLTDVHLRDGDGVEVCLELLKNDPLLPVAVMTGNPLAADRAEKEGIRFVLRKPFSFEEFRAVLLGLAPA